MPAPHRPNTAAATRAAAAVRSRLAQLAAADRLRTDGWLVVRPDQVPKVVGALAHRPDILAWLHPTGTPAPPQNGT